MKNRALFAQIVAFCWLTLGCMHLAKPDLKRGDFEPPPTASSAEIFRLFEFAKRLENEAVDEASLERTIEAYEKLLYMAPNHMESLETLGHLYLLLGDGYQTQKSKQKKSITKAIEYNERVMLNHDEFRKRVENGDPIWEAVDVLGKDEMKAMHFWVTGVFYYYKDCLGAFGQMINFRWIKRAKRVMEHMNDVDPDWGNGMVQFNWACYYLSIPVFAGGDRDLAKEYFDKSIAKSSDQLFSIWGRAKYYYVKMGKAQEFKAELQWIVAQDLSRFSDPFPWKVYFQNDAKLMLENIDQLF